jgi:hypothetical protein
MHEVLIAIAFVFFVACPAIVAILPQRELEDEPLPADRLSEISTASPLNCA